MRNRTNVSVLVLLATVLMAMPGAQAQQPPTSAPDNDFILRALASEIANVLARHGLTEVDRLDSPPSGQEVYLVRAADSVSPAQVIAEVVSQEPSVNAVEEVFLASLPETDGSVMLNQAVSEILGALGDANTVLFDKDSTGTDRYVWTGYVEQEADNLLQASQARTVEKGDGAVVAILDTGIDPDHALFDGHLLPGYDFILDQAGDGSEWSVLDESSIAILGESSIAILGSEDVVAINESSIAILGEDQIDQLDLDAIPDAFGHGTMVAGIVHLVAPEAKIMPLRVFDGDGHATVFDIVRAINYAVDNGATVIHMSFSIEILSPELVAAVDYADQNGVILVASVGNQGLETMVYPAGLCNVFGVASTDVGDYVSSFSNLGNDLVSVAAPGESVITAYPGGGWAGASGTSFAAPWISGAVALLADAKGDGSAGSIGFAQVDDALSWAEPASGSGAGKIGHGRVDIKLALDNLSVDPPTGSSGCSGSSNLNPSVTITAPGTGSSCNQGDGVTFTGTASDTEDGDLTASLAWTSDLDGPIGSGGSFNTVTLSAGTHQITAAATDSVLLTGSAGVTLVVRDTVRDEFNGSSYAGSDGTQSWTGAWQEVGESNGSRSGFARVKASSKCASGRCLRLGANLDDDEETVGDRGAVRGVDLSAASSATLTFNYWRDGGSSGTVAARLDVSGNGGASWITLANLPLDSDDASQQSASFSLESFVTFGSAAQIRFVVSGAYPEESSRYLYVDNVEIAYTTGSASHGSGGGGWSVEDRFDAVSYGNNDGTLSWTGDWVEIGEGNGPIATLFNDVVVTTFDSNRQGLRIRDDAKGVQRSVDLSQATDAVLSFEYFRDSLETSSEYVSVEISADGGSSWTELYRIEGPGSDTEPQVFSSDISSYMSANMTLRFLSSAALSDFDRVHIDSVRLTGN